MNHHLDPSYPWPDPKDKRSLDLRAGPPNVKRKHHEEAWGLFWFAVFILSVWALVIFGTKPQADSVDWRDFDDEQPMEKCG